MGLGWGNILRGKETQFPGNSLGNVQPGEVAQGHSGREISGIHCAHRPSAEGKQDTFELL